MKAYLALISAAALALSACGDQGKPAEPAASTPPAAASAEPSVSQSSEVPPPEAPASPASTAASDTAATPAAGACEAVVESDDAMNFNTKELVIDKTNCKEFKVTLKHTGKMPKSAMGHNIVISKAEDTKGVLADGASAGVDADYVKAGDARVVRRRRRNQRNHRYKQICRRRQIRVLLLVPGALFPNAGQCNVEISRIVFSDGLPRAGRFSVCNALLHRRLGTILPDLHKPYRPSETD